MNAQAQGRLILAGAGPGDPDLITVKALKAIQSADVILYDALVNEKLLDYNLHAEKIFVGKRRDWKKYSQEEIHQLILTHAFDNKTVLRLKGGDPMIFGRAYEEMAAARKFQIPVEVIPGISAYSGMASYNQVPVTQRCVNESLWICTGTTCTGSISEDIKLAAQSSATVIIYMGMGKLVDIVDMFRTHRPESYPMAIIQNATTPQEKIVQGDLGNIVRLKEQYNMGSPALIIGGSAARDIHPSTLQSLESEWTMPLEFFSTVENQV